MQKIADCKTIRSQGRVTSVLRSTDSGGKNETWNLELVASVGREGPALGHSSTEFASALPTSTDQLSQDFRRATEQVVAFVKLHIYTSSHRLHLRRI